MLPGIPFLYVYELLKKFLQAQNIAQPMLFIALLSNVLNAVGGFYLIHYTSWGYRGAAISRTLANISLPCFLCGYLAFYRQRWVGTYWTGWNATLSIAGMVKFFQLGISGMLMMCFGRVRVLCCGRLSLNIFNQYICLNIFV